MPMKLRMSDQSPLKLPFIAGGVITGATVSAWYLYRTPHLPVPDPIWSRFVNVSLILFSAIYVANLLRRLIELVIRRGRETDSDGSNRP
jgi:hypothetical protein